MLMRFHQLKSVLVSVVTNYFKNALKTIAEYFFFKLYSYNLKFPVYSTGIGDEVCSDILKVVLPPQDKQNNVVT